MTTDGQRALLIIVVILLVLGLFWLIVLLTRMPKGPDGTASSSGSASDASASLYERLGGIYAIAAVINEFSDRVLADPTVGRGSQNEMLRQWSVNLAPKRLAGLKWMRTLWVAQAAGGPYVFKATVPPNAVAGNLNLQAPHCPFQMSSAEFDVVARILQQTMQDFKVGAQEQKEVLQAFAAHKEEVIACGSGR